MSLLRKITPLLLSLYALLALYAVQAALRGVGFLPFLTPLNTLLAFSFALAHSFQRLGGRRAALLLATTFIVSLAFESLGVATGWVYGKYHYTDKLGVKFLGLVPLLIPLAWFMMSYPSFVIAERLLPTRWSLWRWRLALAGLGALAMTSWDLAMDPMMVAGAHWVWDQPGAYFGIPLQNYWGWWLTIFVAFLLYLTLGRVAPAEPDPAQDAFDRQAVLSYLITGLSTVVVNLGIGLTGPALIGLLAMLPWAALGWRSRADAQPTPRQARRADA